MSEEQERVSRVLKDFMIAMREWETRYHTDQMALLESDDDTSDCDASYSSALRGIFNKFAIPDDRAWARLVDLGCGNPPTYDPDRDIVGNPEISGASYSVVVEQTSRLRAVYRFFLEKSGDDWKIVKKETNSNGKWKKTAL